MYIDDLKIYVKTDKRLDSLIQTVKILIWHMEFWIEKYNTPVLKSGIKDENYDIMLPNDFKISLLKKGENYKYLGTCEAEDINTKEMKEKVKGPYAQQILLLKSGNFFKAVNTQVVSLLHYSAAFIG